ncbi:MAG: hypothetical protein AB2L12_00455 [Smithellaceae bacterium]
MKTYAIKYLELVEGHAEEMAKRWAKDVRSNLKTTFYKYLDEQKIISQCIRFYQHFSKMFVDEKLSEDILKYFKTYAQESYAMRIPMDEAVYALILMRRHIWLYAEFQTIFSTAIDQRQAVDTLSRTILLFDYAAYDITKEYQELMKKEKTKK